MWFFFVLPVHTKFLSGAVNRVSSKPGKIHAFKASQAFRVEISLA